MPSRVVAVDWSGARVGAENRIWLADVRDGRVVRLENGRSREQVTDELLLVARDARSRGERVVIGLDFSFGFPAWYVHENGWTSAHDMWRAFTHDLVDELLREPSFPFWGRGKTPSRPTQLAAATDTPPLRATERDLHGLRPFSAFQLVGAGAVGVGTLRGMATLALLADAGACIWPFDDDAGQPGAVVLEIWPRLCAPDVRKSVASERLRYARTLSNWSTCVEQYADALARSDDAFDALVSACSMWDARSLLQRMPSARNAQQRIEGCIWQPDATTLTSREVRDALRPARA